MGKNVVFKKISLLKITPKNKKTEKNMYDSYSCSKTLQDMMHHSFTHRHPAQSNWEWLPAEQRQCLSQSWMLENHYRLRDYRMHSVRQVDTDKDAEKDLCIQWSLIYWKVMFSKSRCFSAVNSSLSTLFLDRHEHFHTFLSCS